MGRSPLLLLVAEGFHPAAPGGAGRWNPPEPAVSDRSCTLGPEADSFQGLWLIRHPPLPPQRMDPPIWASWTSWKHLLVSDSPPRVAGATLQAVTAMKGPPVPRQASDPPSRRRRALWKPLPRPEIKTLPVRLPHPSFLTHHSVQGGGPRRLGRSLRPLGLGQESRSPPLVPCFPFLWLW